MDNGDKPAPAAPPTAAVSVAAPAPTPTQTATAAPAPKPTEKPRERRVQLVILPPHAKVEVEGAPAQTKGGLLEISGLPGTVHRVRAFHGTSETTADVVITEAGALPPKIEVVIGRKTVIPRSDGTNKPAAPPVVPRPATPQIDPNLDEFGG